MRVAMVSEHASPLATLGSVDAGGQNVHVASLASALGRAGHDVRVFTRRDDDALPREVRLTTRVTVVHVDAGPARELPKDSLWNHMPEFAARLSEEWRGRRPDVVHSHFWMSGWASLHAAHPLGVPVLHTYHALGVTKRRHQGASDSSPAAREEVERLLARQCEGIVATSQEEMFELVRMGAAPERLTRVPCGVDLEHFRPPSAGAPRTGDVEPRDMGRVLVVSRLVERKGIGDVVQALAQIPSVELLVAGGPSHDALSEDAEAQRLIAIARRAGVEDRLHLLGRVPRCDLPALYHSADVVVCTPWYEPFGLVALEAMACGVPVIASAVGGLVDTVLDGVTGVHVPARCPDALAMSIESLMQAPERRRSLGAAGARRAAARYSWRTVAAETARVYRTARVVPVDARSKVG